MAFSNKLWMREYREKYPWRKHYQWAKSRAKKLGREFSISAEEVKEIWSRDKAPLLKQASIDRIDNSLGYVSGNCRFIEMTLNASGGMKGRKMTVKQREVARVNLAKGWEWNRTHKHHNQYTPMHLRSAARQLP